ncbi:MAG: FHA domain-containing protein [Myxococcales bacterium]|nr:FHA domain-containing protein [Myxococcota bacterium]MDW8281922.1 FHA domain-containing protein [Myxococcales bacterium]
MTLGLVCDACDTLSPLHATVCQVCATPLGVVGRGQSTAPKPPAAEGPRCCPSCGGEVLPQHRFCGHCGTRLAGPQPGTQVKTLFFGTIQQPGRARLVLIKGEGQDGVTYYLNGTEHIAGRLEGGIVFPEDPLLSPRHANFFYQDGQLFVRDEGSQNGIFLRIRGPQIIPSGSLFLVGEQLLRIEACEPEQVPVPDAEGTYFYASPHRPSRAALVQILVGGDLGMVYRARSNLITIGREGNDVNFPEDPFISGRHAQLLVLDDGTFQLTDLGSKNGTFVRVQAMARLLHGDYVFLGQQLLRVEIT